MGLHKKLYAYFIPEIYPLVIYSLWKFPDDDVYCQPKIGSQGYDAVIYPIDNPNHIIVKNRHKSRKNIRLNLHIWV